MAIKYFQAGQFDAPTLRGQNGSLIALLDACLVNGYGQVSVTSITLSGSTATVVTSAAHKMATGATALLAGSVEPEYNGEFQISVVDSVTFTIAVAGSPSSPATGAAITAKRAPAGFSKVFSGTNKAVYRSKDASGVRHYLQVIDDGTTTGGAREAKIRGYVSMSDVDTGSEPFPTVAQSSIGLLSYKSGSIDATNRPWKLISDGKTFYLGSCMDQSPSTLMETGGYIWWTAFGEVIPRLPNDPYRSFIAANNTQNQQITSGSQNGLFFPTARTFSGTSASMFMPRDWNNNIGAVSCCPIGHGWDQTVAGGLALLSYPHQQDNGFYMTQWLATQRGVVRGRFPGVFEPLQGRCLSNYEIQSEIEGYPGCEFMALWGVYGNSGSPTGMLMFDITGDSWI